MLAALIKPWLDLPSRTPSRAPTQRRRGLSEATGPSASSRSRLAGLPTAARRLAALAALLVATLACGAANGEHPRLPPGTPVVLISVDTLRSDRLPAYGYDGVATPAIDALRRDSILFERAYCHVPLTLPSHASMLTGLLPPEHGVRSNLGYRLDSSGLPWLPRLLRQAGYATGGGVSAYVLRGTTGIGADWDFFEDRIEIVSRAAIGRLQRPGDETLARVLPWLRSVAERPFLLFFHIYEPHTPYEPPEPFASRYADRYDGEVAAADRIVGELLDELRGLGLYDDSLVVLLSDHGEALGEHGQPEHEVLIYREILQVPLLLKLPGAARAGETVDRPVQLIDLAPTVLRLLGLEVPAAMRGGSLLAPAAAAPSPDIYSENLYTRLHFGWSELTSLIQGRHHLIYGPDPELYDLVEDPAETRNILRRERRTYGELKRALDAFDSSFEPPAAVDPETREQLAALGYVGAVAAESSGPLPDPKSRLAVLRPLGTAFQAYFGGDYATAAEAFREIVEREPQLVDAWEHLGKSLKQLGRFEEALAAQRKAMEVSAGAPHVALSTAELLLAMDRLEEAKRHAELATSGHDVAWDVLIQIALQEGDLEAAEGYLPRALAQRGTRVGPLVLASELRLKQGRLEEALEITRQAEAELGEGADRWQLKGLYFAWGKAWAQEGDLEQAETFFQKEIELSPDSTGPYTHLAFLYALQDRGPAAGAVLRRMVEANPTPEAYAAAIETLTAMGDERSAAALLQSSLRRWPESSRLRELAAKSG